MPNNIDDWFVNARAEQLKAESDGGQFVSGVRAKQEKQKNDEATLKVNSLFDTNKLLNQNIKRDDYNFNAMYLEQGGFGESQDSLVIPNKYRAPLKSAVAGYDWGTGRQEFKALNDADGVARKAVEQLRTSYVDANNGRPTEDVYPLSQIAYQAQKENKSFDEFQKCVSDYAGPYVGIAWDIAEHVNDCEQYVDYVQSGVWNNKDNPPRKMPPIKHDDLLAHEAWMNSSKYFLEKWYGKPVDLSDEELSGEALKLMSQFNNNLTAQGIMASRVSNASDDLFKKAFWNMMSVYENIDMSGHTWDYFKRGAGNVLIDPATYAGGIVGSLAYKKMMAGRIGNRAFMPILAATISSAPEGFFYGGFQEVQKQKVEKAAGVRDEYNVEQIGDKATSGAAIGMGMTAGIGLGIKGLGAGFRGVASGTNALVDLIKQNSSDPYFPMPGSFGKQLGSASPYGINKQTEMFGEVPQVVDPFYSRLEQAIDKSISKKGGTGDELFKRINGLGKKGDFKSDELFWSGLDTFLALKGNEHVTKQEIKDYLAKNNFNLTERRFTGLVEEFTPVRVMDDFSEEVLDDYDYYAHNIEPIRENIELYTTHDFDAEAARFRRDHPNATDEQVNSHIDDWKDDIAEDLARQEYMADPLYEFTNYDLGVAVRGNDEQGYLVSSTRGDFANQRRFRDIEEVEEFINSYYENDLRSLRGEEIPEGFEGGAKFTDPAWSLQGGTNYREILFEQTGVMTKEYNGGHYSDNSNILFHVRAQDFDTPTTGKTLFVDEIQSDWHNAGKQFGYKGPELDKQVIQWKSELDKLQKSIIEYDKKEVANVFYERVDDIQRAFQVAEKKAKELDIRTPYEVKKVLENTYLNTSPIDLINSIRNSPKYSKLLPPVIYNAYGKFSNMLKDSVEGGILRDKINKSHSAVSRAPLKDDYPVTAIRRMIREAADGDYDSISWTPSEVQSKRWSPQYQKLYELVYDQKMVAEANRIATQFGSEVKKVTMETSDGPVEVWTLKLTPGIKYKAKFEGFPFFQILMGGTGAAMSAQQMEQSNEEL